MESLDSLFRVAFLYWAKHYNLGRFHYEFEAVENDEFDGAVDVDLNASQVKVYYNKGMDSILVDHVAHHEALEVLLWRMNTYAQVGISQDLVDQARHEIINELLSINRNDFLGDGK